MGFKLKLWAELLMQFRIILESGTDDGAKRELENSNDSDASQTNGSAKPEYEKDNDPNDEGIIDSRKQSVVWCTRRASEPQAIYHKKPLPEPAVDSSVCDREIYRRYQQGKTVRALAQSFGFAVQYIRRIIRRVKSRQ